MIKSLVLIAALVLANAASGALPGVTGFKTGPEKITDAELATLLHASVVAADVVAIGESVHGSSGMLDIQTRLIRHLVTNHGLRLIVWENPVLRSLEFARWAASCTETRSPPPIDVLYMPTVADLPLWTWVCDFNRANPAHPVVFRGMDVWDRPWEHHARLRALGIRAGMDAVLLAAMETSCPAARALSWSDIDALFAQQQPDKTVFPPLEYERCRAGLTALFDAARRAGNQQRQNNKADADAAFELALSASTLLGWLGFYHHEHADDVLSWNERDRAQGRNLMLLLEKHGAARAILSAHTSHVSHGRSQADWWGYGDLKSGVHFFTAMSGKRVFNIALTAYEASGAQGHWSLPAAANSLDRKLHDAGHVFSFFTSNAPFLSEHPKWWMQNQNFPGHHESGVEIVPKDHFDAFFFLRRSHLDKALPARPMWRP